LADSWVHGAVCRQRTELRPIFGPSLRTVFEVAERPVSSSFWRKVEQPSIFVLHSTQCHCSKISVHSVVTAITSVHYYQPSTAVQFIQSIQQHTVAETVIML